MTQRTCWSAIVLALSIGWSLPLVAEEPIDWVRQAVLFKTPEVRLREKPDDQAPAIEKSTAALWFYVVEAQDGWLHVDGGWVRSNDVVRKAEAVAYFTAEIHRDPTAFAHACRCRAWTGAKEYDKAFADADAALALDANYAPAYFARGQAHNGQKSFGRAIEDASEAIRIAPKEAIYHVTRARFRLAQGEYDGAIVDCEAALRLDPVNVRSLVCRSAVRWYKHDAEAAMADADEAVRLSPRDDDARSLRGSLLANQGNYQAAIEDLNVAIEVDHESAKDYSNRAACWLALKEFDKAMADADEAVRLDPKGAMAYNNRGCAHLNKGEYDRALSDLDESLRFDPNQALAHSNRGRLWKAKRDFQRAVADLDKAIRLAPEVAEYRNERAGCRLVMGDNDKVIDDTTDALKLKPDLVAAYNNRSSAWISKGKYDLAIDDSNAALRLDPNNAWAYGNRGGARGGKGEFDQAIADCTKAIELDAKLAWPYGNRGVAYFCKGDFANARRDFDRSIELAPENPLAYANRAEMWERKGKRKEAIADLSEFLRLRPDSAIAFAKRAVLRKKLGDLDAAIDDFTESLRLDPNQADLLVERGLALVQQGALDDGIADYTAALELNEKHVAAYCHRAAAWGRTNEWDKVIEDCTAALHHGPNDAGIHYCRGFAYLRLEQPDDALADLDEAIRLNPKMAGAYTNRALVHEQQGRQAEARRDRDEADRLNRPKAVATYGAGGSPQTTPDAQESGTKQPADGGLDEGLKKLATEIEHHRQTATAYVRQARYKNQQNEFDEALADLNEALRLEPDCVEALRDRAWTYRQLGKSKDGLADLNEAIRLAPENGLYLLDRGRFQVLLGVYVTALADFEHALDLASDETDVIAIQVERARLLAGCPDDTLRNGKLALEAAEAAQATSKFPRASCAEALAAAHSECGSFTEAVEWQTKAVKLAQNGPDREERKSQLDLYLASKPFRLSSPAQTKAVEATATDANGDEANAYANAVGIELNDVPADAVLVFAVRPSEIAQCNETGSLIAAINTHFSLKDHTVADLVEIKAAFTDFGTGDRQPQGHAIFRSKAALDWNKFTLDLFGPAKGSAIRKREHAGKTYFVVNPRAAYYMADERTMVTASESKIEEVIEKLSSPQAKITWANRWRRIAGGQLALMVDLEGIDKWIGRDLHSLPPERQALIGTISPLWEHGQQLFLGLHAEDGLAVDAQFYCDGVDSAEKVRASLHASLTLAGNLLDKQSEDSGEVQDDANPMLIVADLARALLKKAELTCDDKIVQWRSHVKFDRLTDSKSTSGEMVHERKGNLVEAYRDRTQASKLVVPPKTASGSATLGDGSPPDDVAGPPLAIAPFSAEQAKQHQEAWAKHLGVDVFKTNSIGMKIVLIPPGELLIGSPATEEGRRSDELQHPARITKPFYIGVYEVTQKEYQDLMGDNPSHFSPTGSGKDVVLNMDSSEYPVERVNWFDAVDFCNQLSEKEELSACYSRKGETVTLLKGTGYRLPTEAEWEYACRAGTTTRWSFGDNEQDLTQHAWFSQNSEEQTHPVGKLAANPFGLYDLYGNVLEWCGDWRGAYTADTVVDPTGPDTGIWRMLRGGAYYYTELDIRSSARNTDADKTRTFNIGFRVARTCSPAVP